MNQLKNVVRWGSQISSLFALVDLIQENQIYDSVNYREKLKIFNFILHKIKDGSRRRKCMYTGKSNEFSVNIIQDIICQGFIYSLKIHLLKYVYRPF